jgi:hypothetical protein
MESIGSVEFHGFAYNLHTVTQVRGAISMPFLTRSPMKIENDEQSKTVHTSPALSALSTIPR